MFKVRKIYLILLLVSLLAGGIALAASPLDYYVATKSTTVKVIDPDGVSHDVQNLNGSVDYFIPNKTKAEWTAFKAAADSYLGDIVVDPK